MINSLAVIVFIGICFSLAYLYLLAFASLLPRKVGTARPSPLRFAVAIPAHDEELVIERTVKTVLQAEYPAERVDVYVVADHCRDQTAQAARSAGAIVFSRDEGERGGKGPALAWLFQQIFAGRQDYDALVIIDADTQVHPAFFQKIGRRLAAGAEAVQGNHVIRNPGAGWFPALAWAMFLIDNRAQNLGRANLGFSAKNMGDSICFRQEIIQRYGWGEGLTEDYQFRQQLLLEGIHIDYEPEAIGYGDAAANWREAQAQRRRWLAGALQSSRRSAKNLMISGIQRRDLALIDGALQASLPSYSTLTILTGAALLIAMILKDWIWNWLPWAFAAAFGLVFLYPLVCLAFDRAPWRAYLVILSGPVYVVWRTWLNVTGRVIKRPLNWVRTPRHIN